MLLSKKTRKQLPLNFRALLILLSTVIPFTVILILSAGEISQRMDSQNAQSYENSLTVFCKALEEEIINTNTFLYQECWESPYFLELYNSERSKRLEAERSICSSADSFLAGNAEITGVVLYNPDLMYNNLVLQPSASYSDAEISELKTLFTQTSLLAAHESLGWNLSDEASHPYWYRVLHRNGMYVSCFVDLDRVSSSAQAKYGLSAPVVFFNNDSALTNALWLSQWNGKKPEISKDEAYDFLSSGGKNYMVLARNCMSFRAVYAVFYLNNMGWFVSLGIVFILIAFFSFFLIWLFFQSQFFRPLYGLVDTMREIRDGNLSLRTLNKSKSEEFAVINTTFNHMLDTISNLKIESYEQKILAEQTELDALRLQIHPHLFLNCLKAIYGLAQLEQTQDIQDMVIHLSEHLRYTLYLSSSTVSLGQELAMCRNYIKLQGIGQHLKPVCAVSCDEELSNLMIPPITLLTLVENACKFAQMHNDMLFVQISASILTIDNVKLANIVVQDNGPGFPSDVLPQLNGAIDSFAAEGHIGIANMVRRFRFMCGDDFSVFFSNQNGARIELMLPIENSSKREDTTHGTADC